MKIGIKKYTHHITVLERSLEALQYKILQLTLRLGSVKLHLVETPQMETFCWDSVLLSKASAHPDTSSPVCRSRSIPAYFALPCVYACQDSHILLFYWLWRVHWTQILVVNLCCQNILISFAPSRLLMFTLPTLRPALSCGPLAQRSFLWGDLRDLRGALPGCRRLPLTRLWARLWGEKLQSNKKQHWTKNAETVNTTSRENVGGVSLPCFSRQQLLLAL